ncbi:MAG: hypothetical protein MSA72_12450 [Lachnospiraceae bacterium]|nr:hypothetical protein [Lachnospiraceae bacterium]
MVPISVIRYKVGNMKVDMDPIRPDKTDTLEAFLEKFERYLDGTLAKYRGIIDDPTKSIRGDSLDDVAFLAALPMVHEALEKIVEAFPDFRYYPPKELHVHYYPEKMTADELA